VLVYHAPINSFKAPHFVDYVLAELRQLGFQPGVQQLYVKTTLDYHMQQIGESVVKSNLASNVWRDRAGQLSSGLIAEDPKTGEILVMVGSPNYNASAGQINYTTIPRNMGSSMKPYTYGAVINARAATVDTPVYDGPSPLVYKDAYSTTDFYNYDRRSHGVLPLKKALANSLNICAVKVELSIGVPATLTYWRNLGLQPRLTNPDGSYNLAKGTLVPVPSKYMSALDWFVNGWSQFLDVTDTQDQRAQAFIVKFQAHLTTLSAA